MKKAHKIASILIFLISFFLFYFLEANISDTTAQIFVTFFSIVFGFYMTSIAILYSSSYLKELYKYIDKKEQKRGIYILKSYILASCYFSIASIIFISIYTMFAVKDINGFYFIKIPLIYFPFLDTQFDANLFLRSFLISVAFINIFYFLLLMHTIIDSLVEESKK